MMKMYGIILNDKEKKPKFPAWASCFGFYKKGSLRFCEGYGYTHE